MIPFAVSVDGLAQAQWVLAVEGDRILVCHEDNSLHWHMMSECRLVRAQTPDQPVTVLPVQPQQKIVIPSKLRENHN